MSIYAKYILPKLVHSFCSGKPIMQQREKVVPLAKGRVLEIGIGSGLNLPFYDPNKVRHLWGLDPSVEMWAMAKEGVRAVSFDIAFVEASAEKIPLGAKSADTVIVTYTLCTIPGVLRALGEMRRVLKSGGELLFCEHGAAPDERVRRWQNRLNPIWQKLSGGCNLNRPVPSLLEQAGFKIKAMDAMYIPGWKLESFNYWGIATIH